MLSWSIFGFVVFVTKIYYTEVAAECGVPSFENNAVRTDFSDSFTTNFVLSYNCRPGYFTNDELSRTCLADGLWTNLTGSCLRKDCGLPDDLRNGDVSYADTVFGNIATYTCIKGYILTPNPSAISCSIIPGSNDVAWNYGRNDRNRPNCQIVTCPKPDNPVNGNASVQGSLEFGTRVLYTCKNEYVLSNDGLKIGTCNENGTWGVAPTCIANYNCGFSRTSSFACGYTVNGWNRVIPTGFNGIDNPSAEANGDSTLTSPVFNSTGLRGCLSFYYRIASRTTNPFQVQLLYNNNERKTLFERQQATAEWKKVELNITENLGNVRWSFSISGVAPRTLLLDEVQLSTSACAAIRTESSTTTEKNVITSKPMLTSKTSSVVVEGKTVTDISVTKKVNDSDSTATTNTIDTTTSPNGGLPLSTIIGIVVGVIVGVVLLGVVLYFIFKPSPGKTADSSTAKKEYLPLSKKETTLT